MHLCAVLGAALGIEDEYNICLHPTLDVGKIYLNQMRSRYLIPALYYMRDNDDAKILYESLLKVKNINFNAVSVFFV